MYEIEYFFILFVKEYTGILNLIDQYIKFNIPVYIYWSTEFNIPKLTP